MGGDGGGGAAGAVSDSTAGVWRGSVVAFGVCESVRGGSPKAMGPLCAAADLPCGTRGVFGRTEVFWQFNGPVSPGGVRHVEALPSCESCTRRALRRDVSDRSGRADLWFLRSPARVADGVDYVYYRYHSNP